MVFKRTVHECIWIGVWIDLNHERDFNRLRGIDQSRAVEQVTSGRSGIARVCARRSCRINVGYRDRAGNDSDKGCPELTRQIIGQSRATQRRRACVLNRNGVGDINVPRNATACRNSLRDDLLRFDRWNVDRRWVVHAQRIAVRSGVVGVGIRSAIREIGSRRPCWIFARRGRLVGDDARKPAAQRIDRDRKTHDQRIARLKYAVAVEHIRIGAASEASVPCRIERRSRRRVCQTAGINRNGARNDTDETRTKLSRDVFNQIDIVQVHRARVLEDDFECHIKVRTVCDRRTHHRLRRHDVGYLERRWKIIVDANSVHVVHSALVRYRDDRPVEGRAVTGNRDLIVEQLRRVIGLVRINNNVESEFETLARI